MNVSEIIASVCPGVFTHSGPITARHKGLLPAISGLSPALAANISPPSTNAWQRLRNQGRFKSRVSSLAI